MSNFLKPEIIRVKIGNKTLRIKDCKFFGSFRGLMFDDMKSIDGALIYGNDVSMHFVKKKLDLLFLDKNFLVIDVQKAVPIASDPKTWKIHINLKAKYCLEVKSRILKGNIKGKKLIFS